MSGHAISLSPSKTQFHALHSQDSTSSLPGEMNSTQFEPVEENGLDFMTTRCKAFIVTAVLVTLAVVITIIIVLSISIDDDAVSNEGTEIIPANLLALSHVAVTNLTLISARSDDDARDACVQRAWIPTGVEWASSDRISSYLCMQQSVEATKNSEDVGSIDLNLISVMRRLVVVSGAETCPFNMQVVVNPSTNLLICMEFVSANKAFDTQQYVVDVMTTTELFYNHETPGWITWPADLRMDLSTSGVYLSVRYPVRPIVALQILTDVTTATIYSACEELEPQGQWESPEFVLKSSESATANSNISDVLICIQRPLANATDLISVLIDLNVVKPTESCFEIANGANSTEIISEQIKLCALWDLVDFSSTSPNSPSSSATSSFVAELSLYETSKAESKRLNISSTISGDWNVVGNVSTGSVQTFVMTKKFEPIALNLTTTSTSSRSSKNETSSAVEAHDSKSSDELSFKVLQIADMHITGNPDLRCSSGPSTFRATLLEAASIIAADLRAESNASISIKAGDDNDPMYYECREALTIAFLDELLDIEQPDFVVFSGDNVQTAHDKKINAFAINVFTARVERKQIPWAAVFGNHDAEGGLTREEMLALMMEGKQFSHVKYGPRNVAGVGNYEVNVVAPRDGPWGEQGTTVFRMYFLDSLATIRKEMYPSIDDDTDYDWIKESQIEFYRQLAELHAAEETSGSNSSHHGSIPAVMFYHIPIPEYALVSPLNRAGDKNEIVYSAAVNCGLFSALVEMGDVKATFVGHDHINEYCYSRQGIQLCYGGGIGLGFAYGLADFERRARVLKWTYNANQTRTLQSWKRHLNDPTQTQSFEILYSE
ncbi:Predicted DNA repair exonuclease SIA1 [Plasmopara halstedii]|uniref:Predicted DNA repair exonuclease SIA1 n=1 Tax=Plasmopara halstedii TaxID=4781 RepID=A0A0P1B563_PLAHL|nr:Predicted DNA repair exonuclease SIA1 [Plasmopara halstedii]CEG49944.1 Predicted DNA repair exonuclease SIA1 [Plasmopara halstedii]|eukprot:XP_024586313.1 Predicted DNA repair exonuclease SIA1 [Plasmopara halstedii]